MFGPGTGKLNSGKIFISAVEFVIVFECKVQFVLRLPLKSHLMVKIVSHRKLLFNRSINASGVTENYLT